jgi:HD-like signal output (HDOD) protein
MALTTIADKGRFSPQFEQLQQELLKIRELPTAPPILCELCELLARETISAAKLAEVLERDPALTSRLLRMANSAYFALAQPVTEVRSACVVLGFDMVKSLAIGVTALESLGRRVGRSFDLNGFWRHSVGVGACAQRVARRLGLRETGTAFCAGVLHDIGKLVLVTLSPRRYAKLLPAPEGRSFRELEHKEYGGDHQAVGEWLGRRWGFPEPLLAVIRSHHDPPAKQGDVPWASILHVANGLASRHGFPAVPMCERCRDEEIGQRVLRELGISPETLARLADELKTDADRVESFVDSARD